MVEKKKILLIISILIVIILLALGLYYSFNPKPAPYYPRDLTDSKLITNQTLIDMIVKDMKSPLGNNLTRHAIGDDSGIRIKDAYYDVAYYVCSNNEHEGWIQRIGGIAGINKLYGPYEWCYV
jgi:hypothetical protein